MEPFEVFIPIAFFACIFGILYVYLMTRNRERMALIEKGADPKVFRNVNSGSRNTLKLGLLLVGVAVGIIMGAVLFASVKGLTEEAAHFSMIFLFGGLALIVFHLLDKKSQEPQSTPKDPLS